jgi:glycosyltransferase involved in cell wall biosynthesis
MRNPSRDGISIVIPVFNSRTGLPGLIEQIDRALAGRFEYEIIAVNDGSRDDSVAVLQQLATRFTRLRIIDLAKNCGQENAILAGLSHVWYDAVVSMDDDLQHDPADIPKMVAALTDRNLDLVFARFTQTGNGMLRNLGTRLNEIMIAMVVEKPRGVELSSFLAMRRFLAEKAVEYCGPHPYLAGQYLCATDRVGNVDLVQHAPRYRPSNYTFSKLLGVWVSGLVNFSLVPLRFLLWCGASLLVVAIALVALIIWNRVHYGDEVIMGWTTLMIAVLMMASFQMFALGLLGEYLGRVLMTTTRYPRHCVRALHNFEEHAGVGESDSAGLAG